MAPIGELNAGIPYGIVKGAHPILSYGIAILGNMVPPALLLFFFPRFEKLLCIPDLAKKHARGQKTHRSRVAGPHLLLDKALALYLWWRRKTEHGISKKMERFGTLALIGYIAIPGPFTGAWSASLGAYLFGIQYRKAILAIFTGVVLAGAIITLMSIGLLNSL